MPKHTLAQTKYYEKLKDPRWQKKRLEIMKRDKFMCQYCGDTKETLNIHHKKYFQNIEPWECDDRYLITVCESCHNGLSRKEWHIAEIETPSIKAREYFGWLAESHNPIKVKLIEKLLIVYSKEKLENHNG